MKQIEFNGFSLNVSQVEVTIVRTYIDIESFGRFSGDTVWDLLVELEETDGIFEFVVIYDDHLRETLEALGVIETNAKGASYCTDKSFKEFKAYVEKELWGDDES